MCLNIFRVWISFGDNMNDCKCLITCIYSFCVVFDLRIGDDVNFLITFTDPAELQRFHERTNLGSGL